MAAPVVGVRENDTDTCPAAGTTVPSASCTVFADGASVSPHLAAKAGLMKPGPDAPLSTRAVKRCRPTCPASLNTAPAAAVRAPASSSNGAGDLGSCWPWVGGVGASTAGAKEALVPDATADEAGADTGVPATVGARHDAEPDADAAEGLTCGGGQEGAEGLLEVEGDGAGRMAALCPLSARSCSCLRAGPTEKTSPSSAGSRTCDGRAGRR